MNAVIKATKDQVKEQLRQLDVAIDHVPADKLHWSPGGCAKTPMEIYLECGEGFIWGVKLLRGETIKWEDTKIPAADYGELSQAKELVAKLIQDYFDELDKLSEARLEETVTPFGDMQIPMLRFIEMPTGHMVYHCGQLNYIQALLGDPEMHY